MARVTPPASQFAIHVSWERASGVTSPELASTWCALEIRVDGRPVTLVEDERGGGIRTAVHTSAYPLAEWVATHWWTLREHVRPSATVVSEWTWAKVREQSWLRHHNLRGAADGMPWPDLTLVPEDLITRVVWRESPGLSTQPISFLTRGDYYIPSAAVREGLTLFVTQVLDRLSESRITGTLLQQEWQALAELDDEEAQFAAASARLGLDVFDVPPDVADELEILSSKLEAGLLVEFLDSADPSKLAIASGWLDRARSHAVYKNAGLTSQLRSHSGHARPWENGYELAIACRGELGLDSTARLEVQDLVGLHEISGDPAGIQGVVQVGAGGVGLVLPEEHGGTTATRFAQARALGISLLTSRPIALLDPAHTDLAKSARAFAAELLAPAAGIRTYFDVLPEITDRAFDAVADRFGASPLLIQRQYENQVT